MKKIFLLFAFLFSVVCYAAPPPDKPVSYLTDDVGVIRSYDNIVLQNLEVQEVAFFYIGGYLFKSCSKQEKHIYVAEMGCINEQKTSFENSLRKLSELYANAEVINLNKEFLSIDKQHSNYGYPFGADFLFI